MSVYACVCVHAVFACVCICAHCLSVHDAGTHTYTHTFTHLKHAPTALLPVIIVQRLEPVRGHQQGLIKVTDAGTAQCFLDVSLHMLYASCVICDMCDIELRTPFFWTSACKLFASYIIELRTPFFLMSACKLFASLYHRAAHSVFLDVGPACCLHHYIIELRTPFFSMSALHVVCVTVLKSCALHFFSCSQTLIETPTPIATAISQHKTQAAIHAPACTYHEHRYSHSQLKVPHTTNTHSLKCKYASTHIHNMPTCMPLA